MNKSAGKRDELINELQNVGLPKEKAEKAYDVLVQLARESEKAGHHLALLSTETGESVSISVKDITG